MFITKDKKRFNPYATHIINNVTYEGNILEFPKICEELGLQEISEPSPPEDFDKGYYTIDYLDVEPYKIYKRKTDEEIAEFERQNIISQIRNLENSVENDVRKITRIFMLDAFEFLASQNGITPDQLYQVNKGYRGLKDLENQIIPLRNQV